MQTIKINIEQSGKGYEFCNGNIAVASIHEYNPGQYTLTVNRKRCGLVDSLAAAVEIVSDKIDDIFGSLGLNVEFN
ncbi:MAG: hypothetical protein HDS71_09320 [Bacteroidales bacterium]|nr:hypothetical protein [Bacteroidales bacterium]